jgi:zinc protease
MLANCMSNCTFKSDLLNSELKAVVQELKMYRDDYTSSIADELVQAMFVGHPYHYPVVGYKNDLCLITPQTLHGFYQQYYVPNNATLVVVGDVNPQDVFEKAALYFGFLSEGPEIIQPAIPWERDFVSKTTTLYRDIQAPIVQCAFAVPGMRSRLSYTVDILSWIIGSGRGSRLYKLLVDKLNIATAVDSFCYDLFDYSLFFVQIQPKTRQNITEIIQQVKEVMRDLIAQGATVTELERAQVKETASYLTLFEDNQKLADAVGKSYLATHDEQFIFNYCNVTTEQLRVNITEILTHWLNPECMNIGYVLPIEERDKKQWQYLQQQSDALDDTLLSNKTRVTELEQLRYTPTVQIQKFSPFVYPHYRSFTLANGLEVLYLVDHCLPKVECVLSLKADYLYDQIHKEGLSNFVSQLLLKGTSKYSAGELAELLENRGITLKTASGILSMNCLSRDLSFALDMVFMVLTDAAFDESAVEQVRRKIDVELAEYWDEPFQFSNDLMRSCIYKDHAYSKNVLGTKNSISTITRDDLVECYKKYITPHGARLAIVGDFDEHALKKFLDNTIGKWLGPVVADMQYPQLVRPQAQEIKYPLNRDQVVLSLAGLSIARKDPRYDSLLLFDQEFGGGILGSMNSQLFRIREQTGLFYTIAGSVLVGVDEQPGLFVVKTIVSPDQLTHAERMIKQVIETSASSFAANELEQAQRAVISSLVDYFASYRQMAATFLALRRFDLPVDYFDQRAQQLLRVTLPEVKRAAEYVLDVNKLVTIKIGRV